MSSDREELEAVVDTVLFTDSYYGDMFREGKGRGALIDAILDAGYVKESCCCGTCGL